MIEKFNVRVYGLLIRENKVLISKESYGKHRLTKFPGGGVEFGEGVLDALKADFSDTEHDIFWEEINPENKTKIDFSFPQDAEVFRLLLETRA